MKKYTATHRVRRLRSAAIEKQQGRCFYCGEVTEHFTADHVRSRFAGGRHEDENIVAACWSCNSRKGHVSLDAFRLRERLKRRDMAFTFAFDESRPSERDWLLVYSDRFIPALAGTSVEKR